MMNAINNLIKRHVVSRENAVAMYNVNCRKREMRYKYPLGYKQMDEYKLLLIKWKKHKENHHTEEKKVDELIYESDDASDYEN